MEKFTLFNPVKLHFGKDCLIDLPNALNEFGKNVLLIYGKNSIIENGLYSRIILELKTANKTIYEYRGIKSNPLAEDVDQAAALGRANKIDLILAVGGGSVIDSAKMLALSIPVSNPVWDFYKKKIIPSQAIPLITVLTLAATGTEMNPYAVLQNNATKEKQGYGSPLIYPKHSFLDPSYTLSVPANYTAYGISDLIAHCLEQYFGKGDAPLADRFVESIISEAMHWGKLLMGDLSHYSYREKIMWCATCALNGTTGHGRVSGDWAVHGIEHSLSVLFDIPHGAGLSIVYPAWLKVLKNRPEVSLKIHELGIVLFDSADIDLTIRKLEEFFTDIGSPIRLSEMKIDQINQELIVENILKNRVNGANHFLSEEEIKNIVREMV